MYIGAKYCRCDRPLKELCSTLSVQRRLVSKTYGFLTLYCFFWQISHGSYRVLYCPVHQTDNAQRLQNQKENSVLGDHEIEVRKESHDAQNVVRFLRKVIWEHRSNLVRSELFTSKSANESGHKTLCMTVCSFLSSKV